MKLVRTICVLGLAVCLATTVYAGTQSVKISGDLTIRGLVRHNYDLDNNHNEPATQTSTATPGLAGNPETGTSDWQTWFMSTTEVQIDADMTDNVSGVIRLFNQRDWDVASKDIGSDNNVVTLGRGEGVSYTQDSNEFDVGVDLAYIELKEFLYSPLTLRIGRQDLWFGKGFIVGANLRDYNNNISAGEYTCMTSFDSVRATLDYDPWTVDLIAAKIWEDEIGSKDDEDLYGVNVGYIFDVYNAEAEGYWFFKNDQSIAPSIRKEHNTVHTVGLRGSADPIENWTASAEAAFQFGNFVGFRDQVDRRARFAWALDVGAECRYFKDQYAWKPVLGAEYIFYSGDDDDYPTESSSGTFYGWDPMYRGKYDTAYREFVGKYNYTRLGWKGARTNYVNSFTDASYTNQHQVVLYGSVVPTESLSVDGRVAFFWQHQQRSFPYSVINYPDAGSSVEYGTRKRFMGTEVDVNLTWDYTEDVSFGLLAAWFFPGGFYDDCGDDTATDLVGTVKLSF
ncbi:MAG: alginate export family protein [Candidatus Omnitrophica bacterium]|nr:alginate export family protein [Candidatus Omnitrophota bacterium]